MAETEDIEEKKRNIELSNHPVSKRFDAHADAILHMSNMEGLTEGQSDIIMRRIAHMESVRDSLVWDKDRETYDIGRAISSIDNMGYGAYDLLLSFVLGNNRE